MTQAEKTRTIKYVLAESSRWLLHRRRDTKKINTPGCREKIRKKRKTKSRKQSTRASKQECACHNTSIFQAYLLVHEAQRNNVYLLFVYGWIMLTNTDPN